MGMLTTLLPGVGMGGSASVSTEDLGGVVCFMLVNASDDVTFEVP